MIMILMGRWGMVSTVKRCILARMDNYHGSMLVLELVLESALGCA